MRLNPFFTETNWLPRLDHFWLGQPLLSDRLTWYEHSNVGYAQFKSATQPTIPTDQLNWAPLPWEGPAGTTRSGDRVATRQELDLPFAAGVVKFDPYVLGELAPLGTRAQRRRPDRGPTARLARQHADLDASTRRSKARCSTSTASPTRWCSTSTPGTRRPPTNLTNSAAVRPDRRQRHRGLSPLVRVHGFWRAAAGAAAVRRTVLRPAQRPGRLGHLALDGNRRAT